MSLLKHLLFLGGGAVKIAYQRLLNPSFETGALTYWVLNPEFVDNQILEPSFETQVHWTTVSNTDVHYDSVFGTHSGLIALREGTGACEVKQDFSPYILAGKCLDSNGWRRYGAMAGVCDYVVIVFDDDTKETLFSTGGAVDNWTQWNHALATITKAIKRIRIYRTATDSNQIAHDDVWLGTLDRMLVLSTNPQHGTFHAGLRYFSWESPINKYKACYIQQELSPTILVDTVEECSLWYKWAQVAPATKDYLKIGYSDGTWTNVNLPEVAVWTKKDIVGSLVAGKYIKYFRIERTANDNNTLYVDNCMLKA